MKSPKTFASVLGSIAWLATMSPDHKERPIAWLEQVVFPALLLKQFKLYQKGEQPMAAIVYGLLSDEHYAAWSETGELPELGQWRSGSNVAVFACVTPFTPRDKLIAEFMAALPDNATNKPNA